MAVGMRMLNGTLHTLYLEGTSFTVLQLKENISERFLIPVEFQKILSPSGAILEHVDLIETEHSGELTLVLSLEEFFSSLEHSNAKELDEALKIVLKSSHLCKGNACAINVLIARLGCLGDVDPDVHVAVWGILTRITERGDERVSTALADCLELGDWSVRCAALEVLPQFTEKGDQRMITAVVACFEDPIYDVRHLAILVLLQITEKGDEHAITTIAACLEHQNADVWCPALEVLLLITEEGDERRITAVAALIEDQISGMLWRHYLDNRSRQIATDRQIAADRGFFGIPA